MDQRHTSAVAPRYLVQDSDGILHSYWRLDLLLCDLASSRRDGIEAAGLWQMAHGMTTRYMPTTYDTLRAVYAAQCAHAPDISAQRFVKKVPLT